ncbi:DUF5592 family protein [Margalitia sp. FSL K6-0131]|uniref:DUF5592 family protein n=1 Tax=Margalitia sp. FSL K6-0131 TaxID=2954604 RepID=UPI004046A7AF
MRYTIPKSVKSEIKITKSLYLKDIVIFFAVFFIVSRFDSYIHKILIIPYYIFFLGITLYFLLPSLNNPKKRNYHSYYYFLIKSKVKYHSLDVHAIENEIALNKANIQEVNSIGE